MRGRLVGTVVVAAAVVTVGVLSAPAGAVSSPAAPQAPAAATRTVALYEMDEKPGSTVLVDSSGNGLNGRIGATITLGAVYNGATGHRFPYLKPNTPPAVPEHLDTVADNVLLDPETADYAVTIRYRTTRNFGNVIQKGQSTQVGGMWKFQQPNGVISCLFRGAAGQVSVNSGVALNDGSWHTVRCERTATQVVMTIDGTKKRTGNGATGMISNKANLSIGGKSKCDQVKITCDYFVGDIDYVQIQKGAGTSPPPSGGAPAFVGAASAATGGKTLRVALPATTAGQQAVMVLSRGSNAAPLPSPAGVTGWQLLGNTSAKTLYSTTWTKKVANADVGKSVTLTFSVAAKMTLTVAVYADVGAPSKVVSGSDTVNHKPRLTPAVATTAGSWVVSYWADKSSSTTSWATTAAKARTSVCASGGGRVCSLLADSNGPVAAGTSAGKQASTDVASNKAVTWSVVLPAAD